MLICVYNLWFDITFSSVYKSRARYLYNMTNIGVIFFYSKDETSLAVAGVDTSIFVSGK